MLRNSISVDVKAYALQKSTVGVSNVILRNFKAGTFENNFGEAASEKKTEKKKDAQ